MKYSQKSNAKRQKLSNQNSFRIVEESPGIQKRSGTPVPVIKDLTGLKKELQNAMLVEHFTIPPYLCALYSIIDGTNVHPARIIRSVVMEEMLHMILVANIMNAIGVTPLIYHNDYIPKYPQSIPNSDGKFVVSLLKFSKEAINTFLRIERPAVKDSLPQIEKFSSIGQFYAAVREALIRLHKTTPGGIFLKKEDNQNQVTGEHYYGSGGKLIPVYDLDDALEAIDEIVGQGEGIDGGIIDPDDDLFDDDVEFAHYFRFNEIFHEQYYQRKDTISSNPSGAKLEVDWNSVHNMQPNPKGADFSDPWLQQKIRDFNKTYMRLLQSLQIGVDGTPNELLKAIPLMYRLKEQAVELMKIPTGNGNYTAGPTFEYISANELDQ